MNMAATNPRVNQMLINAATPGANPRIFAPLIIAEMEKKEE